MSTAEQLELGYTVTKMETRTERDHALNLADFLAAADGGRWTLERDYDVRFAPLKFTSSLYEPANQTLVRRIRAAYRDPNDPVASTELRAFLVLALEGANLPTVTRVGGVNRSWFQPLRRGYWASTRAPSSGWDGTAPAPYPAAVPRHRRPVPPERRALYRAMMRMPRSFGVRHRLVSDAVKNFIYRLEIENGRINPEDPAAPPPATAVPPEPVGRCGR